MRSSVVNAPQIQSITQRVYTALDSFEKGRRNTAADIFDELINNIPEDTQLEILFGLLCMKLGERSQAINYLSKAAQRGSDNASAFALLGAVFFEDGKLGEAIYALERAIELQPNSYEPYTNLGAVNLQLTRYGKAVELLEKAISMKPSDAKTNANLAIAYKHLGRYDDAYKYAQKALKLQPKDATNLHLMGIINSESGQQEEAIKYYMKAIKANKIFGNAYSDMARARKYSAADSKIIDQFENALKESMSASQRSFIHFSLGKMYDDCQEWDKAFNHFHQGNLLVKASNKHTPPQKLLKQVKSFTQNLLSKGKSYGSQSSKPIFVVGMPRSGTTLIEQIIASHPQGAGAGELREISNIFSTINSPEEDDIHAESIRQDLNDEQLSLLAQRYLKILESHREDATRIVDKMPDNYIFLGLIQLLFPKATIIHAVRHPLDSCLSCYFQPFRIFDWSSDLAWISERYLFYRETIDYWEKILPRNKIVTVEYEKLIVNPEAEVRRMLTSCDLPWDPSCLAFNQSSRVVNTASLWQVRQPIYHTSKHRWVNYAKHLQPLIKPLSQYLSDEDKATLTRNGVKISSGWNIRKLLGR